MALEFQLDGSFSLTPEFKETIRSCIPGAREEDPGPGNAFRFATALVSVTAGYDDDLPSASRQFGGLDTSAQLFFRVVDKDAYPEACRVVLACVDRVIHVDDGDLMLRFNGDVPRLVRTRGRVRLLTHGHPAPQEFWNIDGRSRLITAPHAAERWKPNRKL